MTTNGGDTNRCELLAGFDNCVAKLRRSNTTADDRSDHSERNDFVGQASVLLESNLGRIRCARHDQPLPTSTSPYPSAMSSGESQMDCAHNVSAHASTSMSSGISTP